MSRAWVAAIVMTFGCASPMSSSEWPEPAASAEPEPSPSAPAEIPGACSLRTESPSGVSTTTHSYADGRRIRSVHEGPHGSRQTLIEYDAAGQRSKEAIIEGDRLRTRTFRYEAKLLVGIEVSDPSGTVLERHARIYDERGKLRTRTLERRGPQGFYLAQQHELSYDAQGHFTYELETQTPLEGAAVVRSVSIEVDEAGRVRARRVDEGMTGTIDAVSLFDYSPAGKLSTVTKMHADQVASVTRHAYDADGRQVRTTIEDPAGVVHTTTTYDFGCWDSGT